MTTLMAVLVAIALILIAAGGAAVVLTRAPVRQAIALGGYSLLLAVLFVLVQAPDVALAQLVVGAAITPLMVLLAVAKIRRGS